MSELQDYLKWCKDIHTGGLVTCTFCCKNIPGGHRLIHYQTCDLAKRFFEEIYKTKTT